MAGGFTVGCGVSGAAGSACVRGVGGGGGAADFAHGYRRVDSGMNAIEGMMLKEARVHALLNERVEAKKARRFDEADSLREQLREVGAQRLPY